jgi:osmotically inducible protein OsmC
VIDWPFSLNPSVKGARSMKRTATAIWTGNLKEGEGRLATQSGAIAGLPYNYSMRFVDETGKSGTNPEELIAAAHAGCFAMQLSGFLTENGTPPTELNASAAVELIPGTGITGSALTVEAKVPGIDKAKFNEIAERAKAQCPVSGALGAIEITLDARLVS